MYVYALIDGSETVGIYATEETALEFAKIYMESRMWHYCRIRRHAVGGDPKGFSTGDTIWYEDCGQMVRNVD